MHLPKDWGRQFSALHCNLHFHNISTHRPFFKMNIQILQHFGNKNCRIHNTLNSTPAMSSDTLSYSTQRFWSYFCCNSTVLTVIWKKKMLILHPHLEKSAHPACSSVGRESASTIPSGDKGVIKSIGHYREC